MTWNLFDMNVERWEGCAIQSSFWKEKLTMGAKKYEPAIIQTKKENRTRRKHPLTNVDANDDAFVC